MKIKVNKFSAKIFVLCKFRIRELTWLFIGVWFAVQILFVAVEMLIWGETFPHYGDVISTFILSWIYFHNLHLLGDVLIKITGDS